MNQKIFNMKKIFITSTFIGLLLFGCKPEPTGTLGDPADKIAGMNSKWELTSFIQQDPNNPIKEERDLSEFYIVDGQTPYRLQFNKEGNTYTIETGPGRNYFGPGGTWGFDNPQFPSYLYLYSATDTVQTTLGSVIHDYDNTLNIELENYCEDATTGERTTSAIYKFSFNRISQ